MKVQKINENSARIVLDEFGMAAMCEEITLHNVSYNKKKCKMWHGSWINLSRTHELAHIITSRLKKLFNCEVEELPLNIQNQVL